MPYKDPEEQRAYNREWQRKRRDAWFKENGPCRKCGSWNNLQLDHVDRTKKISHSIWSWSKERRDVELAKCQPLCEKCHKEKTRLEQPPREHGTVWMYYKGGCRCLECCAQHEWCVARHAKYNGQYQK